MGAFNALKKIGDAAAGKTDEAVGRAVDDAQEGDIAGVADNLAGSTDEAVARSFDDEKGGGVADGTLNIGHAAIDVPADFVNSSTGTGKNLGAFGVIDRQLDPRASGVGPGKDTFVPPDSEKKETQGIGPGLKAGLGATGATAGKGASTVVSGIAKGLGPQLLKSPALLALVAGAVLWLLRPVLGLAE